jgi:glucosamine--fructose-6-phosphate aminotransferase (isomerizing)
MALAALLEAALGDGTWPPRAAARQALDAATHPQRGGVCIGISHDGGTRATALALQAAKEAGATTALVTATPEASAAGAADIVVVTPVHDDSWCHTVAYASSILAGAALGRELGLPGIHARAARDVLATALERPLPPPAFDGSTAVLVTGAGVDAITAHEAALKIAEGPRIPAGMLHLETILHGHLAARAAETAVVLVETSGDPRRTRRAQLASGAFAELGMPVYGVLGPAAAGAVPAGAGIAAVTDPGELHPVAHRLLEGAVALQRLTLALAAARGVNPDLIRREEEPWRRAAAAAEDVQDW